MCPKFGRYLQNTYFFTWKIVLQRLWMDCQLQNCFSLRMMIFYFRRLPTASTRCLIPEWRSYRAGRALPYWTSKNLKTFVDFLLSILRINLKIQLINKHLICSASAALHEWQRPRGPLHLRDHRPDRTHALPRHRVKGRVARLH